MSDLPDPKNLWRLDARMQSLAETILMMGDQLEQATQRLDEARLAYKAADKAVRGWVSRAGHPEAPPGS